MSTRIVVVRHGETHWNREARIQGHGDSPLTPAGEAQAEAIGERLALERFDRLVASDLGRARQTAQAIGRRTGHAIVADPRFRERNYGVTEGLTYAEIHSRYPDVFARVRDADPDYAVPGGESRRQMYERVSAALDSLAREWAGERVALVCHGGVLGALFRYVHGIPLAEARAIPIPNAAYNVLRHEAGRWHVEVWADTAHLEGVDPVVGP